MILTIVRILACVMVLTGTTYVASDPMTGNWKMNPGRSTLTDEMRVEAAGPNRYTFLFSGDNAETITADGTDQAGIFGTTFAVTVIDDHHWRVVRKKDGKITISAIWELAPDGSTLTDHFTGYRPDGTTSNLLYVYARIDGTSGFAGTWESKQEQVNGAFEMQIEGYGDAGLSFINPAQKMTRSLDFDGKDYSGTGPNLPAGFATSGRRSSEQRIELTDKINGKVLDTQQVELSRDGKTLTITTRVPGRRKPNIMVFDRE